jgi:hypothetical protein
MDKWSKYMHTAEVAEYLGVHHNTLSTRFANELH